MKIVLLLILPALALAQWPTFIPQTDIDEAECQKEYQAVKGCVKDESLFALIEDIPTFNKTTHLALLGKLNNILNCSANASCENSKLFWSYVRYQTWILSKYHGDLESCLADNSLWNEISRNCVPEEEEEPEGPPPVNPEIEICDRKIKSKKTCILKELAKRPEQCSREQLTLSMAWIHFLHRSCILEHQLERIDREL